MTDNPMERRTDRPLEADVPAEEDVSKADAAERLEQDPDEVPNAPARDGATPREPKKSSPRRLTGDAD